MRKLHRGDDDDLAVGLNLEAPPVGFRVQFQGHRTALNAAVSPYTRRAAFLSGGTAWFFNAAAPPEFQKDRCKCLCGKTLPSRSHLLWVCPCTQDLRTHLEPPQHRGEERLLSRHLREKPLAPPGIDHTGLRDDISEAICLALQSQPSIVVATDGSAKDDVAGYSVVVDDPSNHFAGGDDAEDQTPFRAEVCALQLALEALRQAAASGASGHVTVVVDCSAALHARVHCPSMPLAGRHLAQLLQALSRPSLKVQLEWVPAHGRHTAWKPSNPNLDVLKARRLNEAADSSAKACVNRRLRGSLRQQWAAEAALVKPWELRAVQASAQTAQRLHEHLQKTKQLPREAARAARDAAVA